ARRQLGIRLTLASMLKRARSADASADRGARLAFRAPGNLLRWHRRDFDMNVDAIQQRSRDAPPVACYLIGRAATSTAVVPKKAARARIHRGDELKARRKVRLARCARDGDTTRFQRLAQHLENVAAELR